MNISPDEKRVELWMNHREQEDGDLRASLLPFYKIWKQQKYLVAVFESGDEELTGRTESLILHNKAEL